MLDGRRNGHQEYFPVFDEMPRLLDEIDRLQAIVEKKLPVVCICGSTRFADQHAIARWELENDGSHICLMINYLPQWYAEQQGWNGHDHFGEASGTKEALYELHKRKIDLCDWVLVIAPESYVGDSTRAAIHYAEDLGRPVRFVESGAEAREAAEAAKETKP